jgi:hypothetical protein
MKSLSTLDQRPDFLNLSGSFQGIEWLKELKPMVQPNTGDRPKKPPQPILPARIHTALSSPSSILEESFHSVGGVLSTSFSSSHFGYNPSSAALSGSAVSAPKNLKTVSANVFDPNFVMDLGMPTKPNYSYATLIAYAIWKSPHKKMTLAEIYDWILRHFPYYRTAGNGWKVRTRQRGNTDILTLMSLEFYTSQLISEQSLSSDSSTSVRAWQGKLLGN